MSRPSISALQPYFQKLQKRCLPGVWSQGVQLTRSVQILLEIATSESLLLRVPRGDRPVSAKVQLWPLDEDALCDCGDRNEICSHIAASVIFLRAGGLDSPVIQPPHVEYHLERKNKSLSFERFIIFGEKRVQLGESLVSYVGGVSSGRAEGIQVSPSQTDYTIDSLVSGSEFPTRRGVFTSRAWRRLCPILSEAPFVFLDGIAARLTPKPKGLFARLIDGKPSSGQRNGFRIFGESEGGVTEIFKNGIALTQENVLCVFESPELSTEEQRFLSREGVHFRSDYEIIQLQTVILPALRKKLAVQVETQKLPEIRSATPIIRLRVDSEERDHLCAVPQIEQKETSTDTIIWQRDSAAEHALIRKLQDEFHLTPGTPFRTQGASAVGWLEKVRKNEKDVTVSDWLTLQGSGLKAFELSSQLSPELRVSETGAFNLSFQIPHSSQTASSEIIFQAYSRGEHYVPLLEGGWAPLPQNWLNQYGAQVQALLQAQKQPTGTHPNVPIAPQFLPELIELAERMSATLPQRLQTLAERLGSLDKLDEPNLPNDLSVPLRDYQKKGISWLSFLRESGMGGILADDMGLGKTIQALCAIQGKTLIICPTSVLSSWSDQIARFRPSLRCHTYYGANRTFDPNADITLTSYALIRIDRELLATIPWTKQPWNTVIIDEAQTIKNPESQTTQAVHSLEGQFRVALSGTPIENRIDDLWSQFQFTNPGLLGTLDDFKSLPTERIRRKIRPFLLRRLKKEVASELPSRTEIVLHNELTQSERDLYDSLLLSARKEVLEKLQISGNVFAALELLLRLRQACCHPALVPQQKEKPLHSSKIDLLIATLEESISLGHRALVFSQWTSLLDLIEPELQKSKIRFSRLDGSTPNRAQIVDEFQNPTGPSVMLLSLKAGGVGLTLTAADHIFILDPWWNPAVEDQAADRAHRIGQKNPVLIHRLVAKNTLEEKILLLQQSKRDLAQAVLDDTEQLSGITSKDIIGLLQE